MATPLFNTRNRQGVHKATTNSDKTVLALFDTVPNTAYQLDLKVTGYTTSGTASPAAYAYWRRALYVTDSAGTPTLVGSVETPANDLESLVADLNLVISGTTITMVVDASYPINWVLDAYIGVADGVNMS